MFKIINTYNNKIDTSLKSIQKFLFYINSKLLALYFYEYQFLSIQLKLTTIEFYHIIQFLNKPNLNHKNFIQNTFHSQN